MARKVVAVEVEEQIKPLLDQLEGHAAEQQTPLAGAAEDRKLSRALELAKRWTDEEFEALE